MKVWVSVSGHPRHADMDGETVPYHEPFSNGLMYPGDPNGPPEETVNCTCVMELSGMPDRSPVERFAGGTPRDGWLADNESTLSELAAQHGMTVDELIDAVEKKMTRLMQSAEVRIRVSPSALDKILDDGRFLNQFETGTSGGLLDQPTRISGEEFLFNIARTADAADRPIYGYLGDVRFVDAGQIEQYGSVVVRLRPEIMARSTVTWGDSLDAVVIGAGIGPRPFGVGAIESWSDAWEDINRLSWFLSDEIKTIDDVMGPTNYVEAQIYGGVRISDIEEVVFRMRPPAKLLRKLDAAGIPYRIEEYGFRVGDAVLSMAGDRPVLATITGTSHRGAVYKLDGWAESLPFRLRRAPDIPEVRAWAEFTRKHGISPDAARIAAINLRGNDRAMVEWANQIRLKGVDRNDPREIDALLRRAEQIVTNWERVSEEALR